eukprot:gene7958-16291_t
MSDFFDMPEDQEPIIMEPEEPLMPDPEPEDALSAFNRAWNEKLAKKKEAEIEAEQVVKSQASEDMSNWTTQRSIRMHAKKDSNRSEEQVLLEQLESEIDIGNVWDRVTKLIDSGAEYSADSDNADVTRMRKLFIQLKNEPLEASRGAALA